MQVKAHTVFCVGKVQQKPSLGQNLTVSTLPGMNPGNTHDGLSWSQDSVTHIATLGFCTFLNQNCLSSVMTTVN